jgi:cell pole-organizing protein PopZ
MPPTSPPAETIEAMSASQTPLGSAAPGDPSMEDILASIRRILSEDEAPAAGASPPAGSPPAGSPPAHPVGETAGDGVLVLDPAMMVPDPAHEAEPVAAAHVPATIELPHAEPEPEPDPANLVAPAAAAAAAHSVESLVRTLADRTVRVHSGGPTIEDVVRAEIRPLLKTWLDVNLPPMVERLVRAEIERVVGRAVP